MKGYSYSLLPMDGNRHFPITVTSEDIYDHSRILQPVVDVDHVYPPRTTGEFLAYQHAAARVRLRVFDLPIEHATLLVGAFRLSWRLDCRVTDRKSNHRQLIAVSIGCECEPPPPMGDLCGYIAATLRMAIRQWMEHEIDECILIDDERPFDPHRNEPGISVKQVR